MKKAIIKLYAVTELNDKAFERALNNYKFSMGISLGRAAFINKFKDAAIFMENGEIITVSFDPEGEAIKVGMTRGIALAINCALRSNSEAEIWKGAGMSIRECIAHDVDGFDLEKLIPEFATVDDAEAVADYYRIKGSKIEVIEANHFWHEFALAKKAASEAPSMKIKTDALMLRVRQSYIDTVKNMAHV